MGIRSVQIRGFRSIAASGLDKCGALNILIGKNNAGKSNVLAAIELVLLHLKQGRVAGGWPVARRPKGEFIDGNEKAPLRVGVEFDLPADINDGLRARLTKEAPHLERSIEQIKMHDTFAFILAAVLDDDLGGFLFIEQMSVGKLTSKGEDIATDGIRLLSVTKPVGLELYGNLMSARALESDIEGLREFLSGHLLPPDFILQQPKERRAALLPQYTSGRLRPEVVRLLGQRVASATSKEEIESAVNQQIAEILDKIQAVEKRETEGTLSAFAGDSKSSPAYAEWLIGQFGAVPFLHIKERKEEIGREEA